MDGLSLLATENALLLAGQPDEAVRLHGDLIALLCRQGRVPFVVALLDAGMAADRHIRADLHARGLPEGRLLLFGIAGELPAAGRVYDAAVRALGFICWRYDCNVLCASAPTLAVARAAAAPNGLGLVLIDAGQRRLIDLPRRSAREEAD